MLVRGRSVVRAAQRQSVRFTSLESIENPEQRNLEKIRRYQKYIESKTSPATLASVAVGTAAFAPVKPEELAVTAEDPLEHRGREVTISQVPNKTTNNGGRGIHQWMITWAPNQATWSNALMGWTTNGDPMHSLRLKFDSQAEAIAFAKARAWPYTVKAPVEAKTELGDFTYADNFLPVKIVRMLEEEGLKCTHFNNPEYGKSNWFMPLKYHGDGEVKQHG